MPASPEIALVTCAKLGGLDPDDEPLAAALERRGVRAPARAWDDPSVEWGAAQAAILRSTWDYHLRRDEFLAWAGRAAAATSLWNPLDAIRWSTHKSYLKELESGGAPVVPTAHLRVGTRADLGELMRARRWTRVVIKPAVSADSWATVAADDESMVAGQVHLEQHLASRDMMVQPYLPSVEDAGERCLVFIDGALSHAVRKRSLFQGGRHAGPEGVPVPIADDEAALARRVVALARAEHLLYSRVDLARGSDGALLLMELELVEPTLFLRDAPGAADRLAEAIITRADRR